jgi:hypothetical protein
MNANTREWNRETAKIAKQAKGITIARALDCGLMSKTANER